MERGLYTLDCKGEACDGDEGSMYTLYGRQFKFKTKGLTLTRTRLDNATLNMVAVVLESLLNFAGSPMEPG